MPALNAPQERLWDVAIIGGGMGGSMAAHALAKSGHNVLLIEYGNQELTPPDAAKPSDEIDARLAENKWPIPSAYEIDGVITRTQATLGSGIGGSANLYAAALERFAPIDIDPCPGHPTGGWPIAYSELLPHYEEAERLLHVIGTQDPLAVDQGSHITPPPPLGPCDDHFMKLFQQKGLHPYRLHVGIRYRPGCDECLGRLCHNNCRADGRTVLAESPRKPVILPRAEVLRLEAGPDCVTGAIVRSNYQQMRIRAKIFILAAGAIHSPKLLLLSANEHWADGLANRSGMVGRNLMFHANLAFSLWPDKRYPSTGPRKSISLRDFYQVEGQRYGLMQSTGFPFGYGGLLVHLYERFDRSRWKKLRPLRHLLRIQAAVVNKLTGPGTIFVCIIEDMPYPENRVVLDQNEADGVLLKYTIKQELRDRTAHLKKLLRERFDGQRLLFLTRGIELNYGHPCGTCVMHDDPARGVVDREGRAHGITNLFLADASFMPTSAATNPSLTVAANALRVANKIDTLLKQGNLSTASTAR